MTSGFFMPNEFISTQEHTKVYKLAVYILTVLTLLSLATLTYANENLSVHVSHDKGTYKTTVTAIIAAPPELLFKQLTNYNQLNNVSRLIQSSELLANGQLLLTLETCFFFICFGK